MKLPKKIPAARCRAGVMLIECLVYIAVFAILLGIGTAAFFFCWDHTRATISTADEIETALRAGENWRADVRAATGRISVEATPASELVKIPTGENEIIYRLAAGELWRENPAQNRSRLLFTKVKTSEMNAAARDGVTAWCWELELIPPRPERHFPLLFTFEAAQARP